MHDRDPNPKLITCGTASGAQASRCAALSPSSRLISLPCSSVNEAESIHISQESGCSKSLSSIVYSPHHIPNWQDRELWLASKPLIAPLNNQCCSPAWCLPKCRALCVWYICVCVCVSGGRDERKKWQILLGVSDLLLCKHMHIYLCTHALCTVMTRGEPKGPSNMLVSEAPLTLLLMLHTVAASSSFDHSLWPWK